MMVKGGYICVFDDAIAGNDMNAEIGAYRYGYEIGWKDGQEYISKWGNESSLMRT